MFIIGDGGRMRPIEDILMARNIRIASLKDPSGTRVNGKDILEGKCDPVEFMVLEPKTIAFGGDYYDTNSGKRLNFMFSSQGGWEHLSVSTPSKTPSWDQMCMMKDVFFDDEEECVQYHPRKSEYVNAHPHCLHIWRPLMLEVLEMYQENGWIVPREEDVSMDDLLKSLFPDKEKREAVLEIYKAESGQEANLTEKLQFFDKVPATLLMSMPIPPYTRVGTKTREGLEALKDYAKANGMKIGLTGDPDNLKFGVKINEEKE